MFNVSSILVLYSNHCNILAARGATSTNDTTDGLSNPSTVRNKTLVTL